MEPPRPAAIMDREAYLITSKLPRAFDADHLVKHIDIGLLGGSDLTAPATAVHHAPKLKTRHRIPDAVLRGEVEGHGPRAGRGSQLFQLLHGPAPAITSAP